MLTVALRIAQFTKNLRKTKRIPMRKPSQTRAVTGFIDVKLQKWCAIYSKIRILFRIQFAHRSQLMRSNSQEASQ
jgi:hypothetical protein